MINEELDRVPGGGGGGGGGGIQVNFMTAFAVISDDSLDYCLRVSLPPPPPPPPPSSYSYHMSMQLMLD